MEKIKVVCEMEVTLNMIGGKWKPLILYFLFQNKVERFGAIKGFIGDVISQKTLTKQLRELEIGGLIGRKIYPEVPPKVEYTITEKGESLMPILELMCEWGYKNMGDEYELINPLCKFIE